MRKPQGDDSFLKVKRSIFWEAISHEQWNSWVWQQQKRIKSLDDLNQVISLSESEMKAYEFSKDQFRMALTPYYASLIDPSDVNCPIRLQSVPQLAELEESIGELEDPLAEESHMPVPGLTHRYPDRVLLYTTHNCPVYCRHCTRKRKVSNPATSTPKAQFSEWIAYIKAHPEVRDVLVSGGDPLSLSDDRLEELLVAIKSCPNVEIIRIGTRNLVTLPQRVTDELVAVLKQVQPVYIQTHFNHPKKRFSIELEEGF